MGKLRISGGNQVETKGSLLPFSSSLVLHWYLTLPYLKLDTTLTTLQTRTVEANEWPHTDVQQEMHAEMTVFPR
ncbi:hypothetical protein Ancab_004545, partial [Ancistrocladus abbreviatus]